MNIILSKASEFSSLLQRFFTERLLQQRNASPRTVESYRDAFRLFFGYCVEYHQRTAAQFTLNDFNAELVLGFLDYLELIRKNSIRSRNSRLTAIHSFARYVAQQCPPALDQAQRILSIPSKRFEKPLIGFLSREEVRAILRAPDCNTWSGRRDRVMLAIL
jgi:site-specific recombinase XerD